MPRHTLYPALLPRKQAHQQVRLLERPHPQHDCLSHPLHHPLPAKLPQMMVRMQISPPHPVLLPSSARTSDGSPHTDFRLPASPSSQSPTHQRIKLEPNSSSSARINSGVVCNILRPPQARPQRQQTSALPGGRRHHRTHLPLSQRNLIRAAQMPHHLLRRHLPPQRRSSALTLRNLAPLSPTTPRCGQALHSLSPKQNRAASGRAVTEIQPQIYRPKCEAFFVWNSAHFSGRSSPA